MCPLPLLLLPLLLLQVDAFPPPLLLQVVALVVPGVPEEVEEEGNLN